MLRGLSSTTSHDMVTSYLVPNIPQIQLGLLNKSTTYYMVRFVAKKKKKKKREPLDKEPSYTKLHFKNIHRL